MRLPPPLSAAMDDDSVFTKRFKDCVRKPHAERTEQVNTLPYWCFPPCVCVCVVVAAIGVNRQFGSLQALSIAARFQFITELAIGLSLG